MRIQLLVVLIIWQASCSQRARRECEARVKLDQKSLLSCRTEVQRNKKVCAAHVSKAEKNAKQTSASLVAFQASTKANCICRTKRTEPEDSVFLVHSETGVSSGFIVERNNILLGICSFHGVSASSRVLLSREIATKDGSRQISVHATVVHTNPLADIAVLSFPKGSSFQLLMGPPLGLATAQELQAATGTVQVMGATSDPASIRGAALTTIHRLKATITSPYQLVSPVNIFSRKKLVTENPHGFSITASNLAPGFSGSPAVQSRNGKNVVLGLTVSLAIQYRHVQKAATIVGAVDLSRSVDQAILAIRRENIASPKQVRPLCQSSFRKLIKTLRPARHVAPSKLTSALSNGTPLVQDFDANVYRHISPSDRRLLFSSSRVADSLSSTIAKAHAGKLSKLFASLSGVHRRVCGSPTGNSEKCGGTAFLSIIERLVANENHVFAKAMRNIGSRARDVAHFLYTMRLRKAMSPSLVRSNSTYVVELHNGRTVTGPGANGRPKKYFRYDVKDGSGASKARLLDVDFEFPSHGRCLLSMARLNHSRVR